MEDSYQVIVIVLTNIINIIVIIIILYDIIINIHVFWNLE